MTTIISYDAELERRINDRIIHFPRDCIECDTPGCGTKRPRHRCSRCQTKYYCSSECQKKDWKTHKPDCIPIDEMKSKHKSIKKSSTIEKIDESTKIVPENASMAVCPICLDQSTTNSQVRKECKHGVCSVCVTQWHQCYKVLGDMVVAFSPSDDADDKNDESKTEQQGRWKSITCPICRADIKDDSISSEEYLMQKAILCATKASALQNKNVDDLREELLREGLSYLDQILDTTQPLISAYFSKAEILLELKEGQLAVDVLKKLFEENEARLQHPVMKLFHEQDEAVAQFNRARYDALKLEIEEARKEFGMPASRMREESIFEAYLLQYQAYEMLQQWEYALESFQQAGMVINERVNITEPRQRHFLEAGGRCFFEVGQYEKAIVILNSAIEINRHCPGVHKYKALSQEKLGKYDDAIQTISEAVLYETPWDPVNQLACLELYDELKVRMKEWTSKQLETETTVSALAEL